MIGFRLGQLYPHDKSPLYLLDRTLGGPQSQFERCDDERNLTFRGSMHRKYIPMIYFQQDATLHSLFISGKLLYMLRVVSPPIISSAHNCIYSIWYLSTVTSTCRYCGRIGTGSSVVWELYWSVLVRLQPHQNISVQFPHSTQIISNYSTIAAGSSNG